MQKSMWPRSHSYFGIKAIFTSALGLTASRGRILAASIEEVVALDPRNDDKPAIKEFTTQWLAKVS